MDSIVHSADKPYEVPLNVAVWMAFKPIIKIYISIGVGFVLAKKKIITPDLAKGISRIVLQIFLPCLIFNNIVSQIKDTDIKILGVIVFSGFIFYTIGFLWGLVLRLISPIPRGWFGGLLLCCMINNCSDLPLAYVQAIGESPLFPANFSDRGEAYCVLFVIIFIVFAFNLGGTRLVAWDASRIDPHRDEPTVPLISWESFKKLVRKARNKATHQTGDSNDSHNFSDEEAQINSFAESKKQDDDSSIDFSKNNNNREAIITELKEKYAVLPEDPKATKFCKKFKFKWFKVKSKNMVTRYICNALEDIFLPQMMSLIAGIIVAMIPWVRRCFVHGQDIKNFHDAPDELPPLHFFMQFLAFFAAAQVPLGLMLLGATIASLKIGRMVKGFWKTLVLIVVFKLAILPIIACGWITRIRNIGWIDKSDAMTPIVLAVAAGTPSATVQIYLTMGLLENPNEESLVMNCLAVSLMAQYLFLPITLTFLVTFVIKNYV